MHCWKLLVSGHVQGVFFRQSTKEQADLLGVTGYVRNLPDGDVEIVAQGDEDKLQRLQEWSWQGPPQARVTDVKTTSLQDQGNFSQFLIRQH